MIHPLRFLHLSSPPGLPVVASRVISDMGSNLGSRVVRESADKIEPRLVLKPDLCGRDGQFEKAEFMGAEGRIEQPISSRRLRVSGRHSSILTTPPPPPTSSLYLPPFCATSHICTMRFSLAQLQGLFGNGSPPTTVREYKYPGPESSS